MTETAAQDDGKRIRVWKDIGPQASFESINEVLTLLRSVQAAAEAADDIAGGYFSGTGQEAERPARALWIDRLTFENPLEVLIGGPLCLLAYKIIIVIRDWRGKRFESEFLERLWDSLTPEQRTVVARDALAGAIAPLIPRLAVAPTGLAVEEIEGGAPDHPGVGHDLPAPGGPNRGDLIDQAVRLLRAAGVDIGELTLPGEKRRTAMEAAQGSQSDANRRQPSDPDYNVYDDATEAVPQWGDADRQAAMDRSREIRRKTDQRGRNNRTADDRDEQDPPPSPSRPIDR